MQKLAFVLLQVMAIIFLVQAKYHVKTMKQMKRMKPMNDHECVPMEELLANTWIAELFHITKLANFAHAFGETLFLPNDMKIRRLLKKGMPELDINKSLIEQVEDLSYKEKSKLAEHALIILAYHVSPKFIPCFKMINGHHIPTLLMPDFYDKEPTYKSIELKVRVRDHHSDIGIVPHSYFPKDDDEVRKMIKITRKDIYTCEGFMVHKIDRVLLPSFDF